MALVQMSIRCLPICNERRGNIVGATKRLVAYICLGVTVICSSAIASAEQKPFDATLKQLESSVSPENSLGRSIALLNTEIATTRETLHPSLKSEFDDSVQRRLHEMIHEADGSITAEYRNAILAMRVLELAEHVAMLPLIPIPADEKLRNQAKDQIDALLSSLDKKSATINRDAFVMTSAPLRQILKKWRQDIFSPSYGRPLSQSEYASVEEIVNKLLDESQTLSKKFRGHIVPPVEISNAARIARSAQSSTLEFLSDRDAPLANDPRIIKRLQEWEDKVHVLQRSVVDNLARWEKVEGAAIVARAHRQSEQDLETGSPERIQAQTKLKEQQKADEEQKRKAGRS